MEKKALFREFRREFKNDNLGDVAAMMTYYAIFALFPMMLFVITMAMIVLPRSVLDQGVGLIAQAMPGQAAALLQQHVGQMADAAGGGLALGTAALALWGASRGAVSLGRALNGVYDKKETRPWWKIQLVGLGTTLLVAVLLLLALGLLAAGPAVGHFIADRFGLGGVFDFFWTFGRWLGAAVLVMLVWALLYKFLPNTKAPLRVFTPGAMIGVALWVGASLLFALYVNNFGKYEKTYGALGTVIVFLTWLYISNFALLVGAELNDVIEGHKIRGPEEKSKSSAAGPQKNDTREPEPA